MSSGSFGLLLSTQVSVSEGGTLLQFLFLCVFCFFFFAPQLPNAPKRKRGDTVWEVEEDASWQKTGNPTGAKAGTSFSFRLE